MSLDVVHCFKSFHLEIIAKYRGLNQNMRQDNFE